MPEAELFVPPSVPTSCRLQLLQRKAWRAALFAVKDVPVISPLALREIG
jgi:hypothetical protein